MERYRLTEKAIEFVKQELKNVNSSIQLMAILQVKEKRIKELLNENTSIRLTMPELIEYIKKESVLLKSETDILERYFIDKNKK